MLSENEKEKRIEDCGLTVWGGRKKSEAMKAMMAVCTYLTSS